MLSWLRRGGRWLLRCSLRLLPEGVGGPIDPWQSVLVVRTDDRLGNLLLTTPLLAALRQAFPRARIGLVCAARRAVAVRGTGLYDELWAFEKRDLWRRPWRFLAWCFALRRARYQVAIEAGHFHAFSFTAAALAVWSGAPVRIGHRRGEAGRLLSHPVAKDPAVLYDGAAKLELLQPLGVGPRAVPPLRTELGKAERAVVGARLGPALVVYPGGRKPDHRWSEAGFALAIERVGAELGLAAWVAWGPGEKGLAERLCGTSGAQLLWPTDLEQLAAVFRCARLVLTNDTGPMHLAVAVGAPTLAILLAADGARWASPQSNFASVRAADRPASDVVEELLGCARELLARPPKRESERLRSEQFAD